MLEFDFRHGEHAKSLPSMIRSIIARGETPGPHLIRPRLPARLIDTWNAFSDLSTCRPAGMAGALPIPWTAIRTWCADWVMSEDEAARFSGLIRAMDAEWLAHVNKKPEPPKG